MRLINFFIVLGFNIYWASSGLDNYKSLYNGDFNKWLSLFAWAYTIWGICNLIYIFI